MNFKLILTPQEGKKTELMKFLEKNLDKHLHTKYAELMAREVLFECPSAC